MIRTVATQRLSVVHRCLLVALVALGATVSRADQPAKLVEVRKIWDQAPHNAFTDLVRYHDRWFCVFREGAGHVSPDGALRVLTSVDGNTWESAALVTSTDSDLRDAKITITPDGQLMLSGAGALHDKSKHTHQSLVWFSKDGRTWSKPHPVGDPDFWLWRTTWHKGTAYGIGYGCNTDNRLVRLYTSADGKKLDTLVEKLHDVGYPNETSMVFDGETCYCLLRRDEQPNSGLFGISQPPYKEWEWKDLGARIGGPHMIRLADGRFVAAVRLYDGGVRTSLVWIDPKSGKLAEFLKLPSSGDTSYAGLVMHDGLLWVSYYSSHEGKTSIYLAKVQLPSVVREIGSRRELFVDDYLIERLRGVKQQLHRPQPRDVALVCDAPWEGNTSAYYTLFADGDRFRMYYRGEHFDVSTQKAAHPEVTCYAESRDGINWEKPKLGLFEFAGSKDNNIVHTESGCHNFTPFKDENPNCSPDARYKALAGASKQWGKGLQAYKSPDGIHWTLLREEPVITDGNFDSQNLAFWDAERKCYLDFHRKSRLGVRDIMTATSSDFLNWTQPVFLEYGSAPREHLYTNAIQPYVRAPHLLLGFPTRFQPAHEQVEPILMTSRDALNFHRWSEELIPITAPAERDGNRSNYMTWGLLKLPGQDRELSVYATERYYAGPGSRVRRFTFRTDGFVSLHADSGEGEVVTRPVRFEGKRLSLNYAAANGGGVRVELQDEEGKPIPGFSAADCRPLAEDAIDAVVAWSGGDLSSLAARPVRLRFVIRDADVYSIKFTQ